MGDPKKIRKKFDRPKKPWDKARLETEKGIMKTYGLKNKKELWRFETFLRGKRQNARKLLTLHLEERHGKEAELIKSFINLGLLTENAALDDAFSLSVEALLERRLQTMVFRKDLANNLKQARQFIVHGHIAVNGRKVSLPNYVVRAGEEEKLGYFGKPMLLEKALEKPVKAIAEKEIEKKAETVEVKAVALEKKVEKVKEGVE